MQPDPLFLEKERLFNSVEVELLRRWAFSELPDVFRAHPASVLKCFVKAWWHLYHETDCVLMVKNRTVWIRSHELSAPPLDTEALLAALLRIRKLIVLDTLLEFRPIQPAEESAVAGLQTLIHFFGQAKEGIR